LYYFFVFLIPVLFALLALDDFEFGVWFIEALNAFLLLIIAFSNFDEIELKNSYNI